MNITKACFSPARHCANCMRKHRYGLDVKTDTDDLKRCTGCHLMSYCDKDCQREHWSKVHKKHCKVLSGRTVPENSRHVANTCSLCKDEKKANRHELVSSDSPKTNCHMEAFIMSMRSVLSCLFAFHLEGRSCRCKIVPKEDFACQLPFSLGEISGEYVGKGLDQMLAHAIKIVNAMLGKSGNSRGKSEKAMDLLWSMASIRGQLWHDILISGVEMPCDMKEFSLDEAVDDLAREYESSDVWWMALKFTIDVIYKMANGLSCVYTVTESLRDSRFQNLLEMNSYFETRVKSLESISENNLWPNLKLWPTKIRNSLVLLLPDGICCKTCKVPLSGPVRLLQNNEEELDGRPVLTAYFDGVQGAVAFCPVASCMITCVNDDITNRLKAEGRWEKYFEDYSAFLIVARTCDLCLKNSLSCHRCSSCYAAQYCSPSCQRKDLTFHKTVCEAWVKDYARQLPDRKDQKKIFKSRLKNIN